MKYMIVPDITTYEGVVVDAKTKLKFDTEEIKQTVKDLVLVTKMTIKGKRTNGKEWIREQKTTLPLVEGDVLIKDPEHGYVLPEISVQKVEDVIADLEAIKE